MYIDVHAHIDHPLIKDTAALVARARAQGVLVIINNGLDPASNRSGLELAKRYPEVKAAIGIYPLDAETLSDEDIASTFALIRELRPIAIGEVGLDASERAQGFARQERVFTDVIRLAKELGVPLIIHSRKAEARVLELLEQEGAKKVLLHCFCGRKQLIRKARELGYYLSVPANVVRSGHFQLLVREVPITQLFTETDTPFLGPDKDASFNEPANIPLAVRKIAEIKGMDEEEVKKHIFFNYQRLFLSR